MTEKKIYTVTLQPSGVVFEGDSESTILDSAVSAGIVLEHSCKTGVCGVCEAQVFSGDGQTELSVVLTCQHKPTSDMNLKAEYFPELDTIKCMTFPAKVSQVLLKAENIMVLKLRYPPKSKFSFLPGQYIDLKYQGVTRSYSLASIPNEENTIELHFKRVERGEMSEKIFAPIAENQLLQLEGPKGTFFLRDKKAGPIIFIATGTGYAPVKSMVSDFIQKQQFDRPIYVYWGNRSSNLFYDKQQLLEWANNIEILNAELCLSRSDIGWTGRIGYVQDCVLEDGISLSDAEVYACGSIEMIESAKSSLIGAGLDKDSFYSDAFVAS